MRFAINPWPLLLPLAVALLIWWQDFSFRRAPNTPVTSQFRGDERRSAVSVVPQGLLDGELREVWRRDVGNVGIHSASKASPAVDDSGVYVGSDSGWFFAFDHDGNERWRFLARYAQRGIHATAALDQDSIYVGAYNGVLYRLAKADGRVIWQAKLGDAIGSSVLLKGDFAYVSVETFKPGGHLAKVRRSNGRLEWRSAEFGEQGHASPTYHDGTGLLITGDNSGRLTAWRDGDGGQVWSQQFQDIKSTPLIHGGLVFITSWDGFLHAINPESGGVMWSASLGARSQGSPTALADVILAAARDGSLHGIGLDGRVRWTIKRAGSDIKASALALSDGILSVFVVACGARELCLIEPGGKILRRLSLRGELSGAPVYFNRRIYLSEDEPGGLTAYGFEN